MAFSSNLIQPQPLLIRGKGTLFILLLPLAWAAHRAAGVAILHSLPNMQGVYDQLEDRNIVGCILREGIKFVLNYLVCALYRRVLM